jgi:hypothetical protein
MSQVMDPMPPRPKRKYRILEGRHIGDNNKQYGIGCPEQIVESEVDLVQAFNTPRSRKFEYADLGDAPLTAQLGPAPDKFDQMSVSELVKFAAEEGITFDRNAMSKAEMTHALRNRSPVRVKD